MKYGNDLPRPIFVLLAAFAMGFLALFFDRPSNPLPVWSRILALTMLVLWVLFYFWFRNRKQRNPVSSVMLLTDGQVPLLFGILKGNTERVCDREALPRACLCEICCKDWITFRSIASGLGKITMPAPSLRLLRWATALSLLSKRFCLLFSFSSTLFVLF